MKLKQVREKEFFARFTMLVVIISIGLSLVTKSCKILSDFMDCSPPGSSVHGILQARIVKRIAMPFSRGSS